MLFYPPPDYVTDIVLNLYSLMLLLPLIPFIPTSSIVKIPESIGSFHYTRDLSLVFVAMFVKEQL